MKRTALLFSLIAAALLARADYETLPIEVDEAMGDYVRFESRPWAAEMNGEGGRLSANTTWNGGEYIILNDLYVPSGVTLTIGPGTKIRFCEGTCIKVEDGGQLVLNGENGKEVVLTGYDKDTVFDGITLQSGSAGYSDNDFVVAEGFAFGKFATVSLSDTTAFVAGGQAIVPVTVSGSRDGAFSFDWVAETNGVAFASGTMNWNRVGDGSKNIVVPFDAAFATLESFTVRASLLRCCTARKATSVVTLSEFITSDIQTDEAMGDFIRFESRDWTTNFTDVANVEGGRLTENTVWSGEHVVVGNVYIPSGVTLTLTADTVVRFCEGTMIKIEDGGTLRIIGADGHDIVLCGYDDETEYVGVVRMSSGTLTDNSYVRVDGPSFGSLAKVALNDSDTFRTSGLALIPVTVSGSRDSPFSIDWVAETNGVPYKTGTVRWNRVGDGTKNISINYGAELDGLSGFTVRVAVHRACFANPDNCYVTIRDFDVLDVQSNEAMGDFIRFESRDWTTNFTEVVNVEGGRLTENTVWSGEHVIMNDVYIPSGVTLTITADALVRLCEGTMIKIEDGGTLRIIGADGHDVVIRNFDDDTTSRGIVKMPSGNYSDNMYVQYPDFRYGSYPNVTLHDAAVGRDAGKVYVPLTLGGSSRDQSFNVDWETDKGASGTVTWSRSGDGTKLIELPIEATAIGCTETYAIRLTAGRGANLAVAEAKVTIYEFDHPVTESVVLSENVEQSPDFSVHGDIRTQPVFLNETEELRYSGHWQSECAPNDVVSRISVESDNGITRFGEWPGSEEGSILLKLADYNVGRYTLRHEIVQKGTDNVLNTLTKTFSVVDRDDVELHGGTLTGNEVWKSGKVHVVYATVVVPGIYTLFIEPGAIVKFMTGTGIDISQGGALFANAIVFTHINDDTVGGDTLSDGYTVAPPMDAYFLSGNFTFGDDAELRNITQKTALTGTLNGTKMLSKGSTYRVGGTFTIANGATLTIPAGTILKMEQGAQIVVNAGGTLKANGTRAAPVVFTSINDDSYSGKTEGSNSNPQPGDWHQINVRGTALLNHVNVLWCSRGNNQGGIYTTGGTTVLNNSIVAHCMYDCVRTTSGSLFATNSIMMDSSMGAAPSGGFSEFVNCVLYDLTTAVRWPNGKFVNCIFYRNREFVDSSFGTSGLSFSHCVWGNPQEDGLPVSCSQVGKNGNVWGDPLFVDPANGDFRIREGSPCVDAADSSVAPELDYFGQPRITFTGRTNDTELVEGPLADIGICEVMPRDVTSDIDLVPEAVRTEETATPGQLLFVKWEVRNQGGAPVDAAWRDTVSLVSRDGREVVLGDKATKSAIAVGGSVFCSGYFTVPAMAEGTWYPKVNVNSYHDIFEGSLTANNALVGAGGVEVTIETLELPTDGNESTVSLPSGGQLAFRLSNVRRQAGGIVFRSKGELMAWLGRGAVAGKDNALQTAVKIADDVWLLPISADDDLYVSVSNEGSTEASCELSFKTGDFFLLDTGKVTAGNKGEFALPIYGNGFDSSMSCWLEKDGTRMDARSVLVNSIVSATVVFDLDHVVAGDYVLHVEKDGREDAATLLTVVALYVGPLWNCGVDITSSIRLGRVYTGSFTYENRGDTPMLAPYVRLTANKGTLIRFSEADAWTTRLEFMATSDTYPASSLKAGDASSVKFFYKTSGTAAEIEYAYTLASSEPFPWDDAKSEMKPSFVSPVAWEFAFKTLQKNLGLTWNDYLNRMRMDCDHLIAVGSPVKRMDRLWQLEIADALGNDMAVPTLATVTDLTRTCRGLSLSFVRTYSSAMHRRFNTGIFGVGWMDNYSIYAERADDDALIFHLPSGGSYAFTKVTGSWQPEDGRDKTILEETPSEYVLSYSNGTVQRFSKSNMKVSSIIDNQGNSLSFQYSGTLLTKVCHSDGPYLVFSYANGRLVSVSDDHGRMVSYAYSGDCLTSVTAYNGLATAYQYNENDNTPLAHALSRVIYPDGATREYAYDDEGRLSTSSANGGKLMTRIKRGTLGSYTVVSPNGGKTQVTVGANGETLKTVNAIGEIVKQMYTPDTLLEATIAPSGKRSKITYNNDGSPVSAMSASGATTTFSYTADFDNLASVTDARGNSLSYGYDVLGRSTSVRYVDDTASHLEYNEKGDIVKSTNRRGESVAYEYDDEGRIVRKTWDNGRVFSIAYDAKGNVVRAEDSETGVVSMEYDENERLTKIVYPKNRGFTFRYDTAGRQIERASLDGTRECYEYDSFGRLSRVTDGNSSYLTNAYDPNTGWLVTQTYGNGTVVSNAYDKLGRTAGIYHLKDHVRLAFFEYAYDADGKCISQTTAEGVESYAYDADGQLTGVTYPDGTSEQFAYDAAGNRISANDMAYTVNKLNQYTTVVTTPSSSDGGNDGEGAVATQFTYDLDGNLTSKTDAYGTTVYTYDTLNRLIAVTNETKNIHWSCAYDVFGNRVSVTDNGTTTEKVFVQGSLASVAAEYVDDALVKRHVVVGAVRVADKESGSTRYYHSDLLGSTRLTTDDVGVTKSKASYKAFGGVRATTREQTDAGYVGTLGVETDANGFLFMRNRYYDADIGRFVQMDPLGINSGDLNCYRYCKNVVMSVNDPSGLFSEIKVRMAYALKFAATQADKVGGWLGEKYGTCGRVGSFFISIGSSFVGYGCDLMLEEEGVIRKGEAKLWSEIGKNVITHGTKNGMDRLMGDYLLPGQSNDSLINRVIDGYDNIKWLEDSGKSLYGLYKPNIPNERSYFTRGDVVMSCDPNEMSGPLGLGDPETERYVKPGEWMTYTVYFENRADATAAAQEVRVTNPLSEYLDWSTFEMGEIAFGNQIDLGLSGRRGGTSEAAMKGTNTLVRTQLTLDEKTGTAEWYLRIVDPTTATGWPEDVFAGFLPPNDETFRGEGHLTYRVKVRDDAPHGVRIANAASIVFDYNEPIATDPSWWNTVARTLEAGFVESEVTVDEGGTATVAVQGGSAERATSVQVYLSYQTASAADLDLKNAKVDGATPKGGVKFPLTLSWAAGEIGTRSLAIPVKLDKAVEDDEAFTLQLAAAQGMPLGAARTCTVTIRDAAEKPLPASVTPPRGRPGAAPAVRTVSVSRSDARGGFVSAGGRLADGSSLTLAAQARPGWEFRGWASVTRGADGSCATNGVVSASPRWRVPVTNDAEWVAVFARIPYVRALADPADGGKVSGSGYCPAGKRVTLRASASGGFAFAGWYAADAPDAPVATTPALVLDRTAKRAANSKAQTVLAGPGSSTTYLARFAPHPEVAVSAVAGDGVGAAPSGKGPGRFAAGTVTGAGRYAPGRRVVLRASANRGYVFGGWWDAARGVPDPLSDEPLSREASLSFDMPPRDVSYAAGFVTAAQDRDGVSLALGGAALAPSTAEAPVSLATNVRAGVYLEWPLAPRAPSAAKVRVSGLPAGLRLSGGAVRGAPSAARVAPYAVRATVTTAGGNVRTYRIDATVDPLPAWAQGTFSGVSRTDGGATNGPASVAVTAAGKVSAKQTVSGRAASFTAPWYDRHDAAEDAYHATLTAKVGAATVTNRVAVRAAVRAAGAAAPETTMGVMAGDLLDAWQTDWKRGPWKGFAAALARARPPLAYAYEVGGGQPGTVALKFGATGAVAAAGTFAVGVDAKGRETTAKASCSATLLPQGGDRYLVFVYFPPKGAFRGHARCLALAWDGEGFAEDVAW